MAGEVIKQAVSIDVNRGGIAASHPLNIEFPKAVATTQEGKEEHNTLMDFLVVVGCSLIPKEHFLFDSSFVLPSASESSKNLSRLRKALMDVPGLNEAGEEKIPPPLSIFGHADRVGDQFYNSSLSRRRASAIYGMLIHDVDIWEDLFHDKSLVGDQWGNEEFGVMLDTVGLEPEFPLGSTDEDGRKAALNRLKSSSGKTARAILFDSYFNAICIEEDDQGNTRPLILDPEEDFLARGAGNKRKKEAKGDVQGCGEFNQVFIQSQEVIDAFEQVPNSAPEKKGLTAARDAANAPNRRVIIYLFKPGSRIDPEQWPCPHRNEDNGVAVAQCRKRFWKKGKDGLSGDDRMKPSKTEERKFKETSDTFACRFYQQFASNSPCEGILKVWSIKLAYDDDLETDKNGQIVIDDFGRAKQKNPVAGAKFVLQAGDETAPIIRGQTDDNGELLIPVFDEVTQMTLQIHPQARLKESKGRVQSQGPIDEDRFILLPLSAGTLRLMDLDSPESTESKEGMKQRLYNLGYGRIKPLEQWDDVHARAAMNTFQRKHDILETAEPDFITLFQLRRHHGS